MLHKKILFSCAFFSAFSTQAQQTDSVLNEKFSFHFQNTIITQYKPAFKAAYSGSNSLIPQEETQTSITATIFASAKLWKGGSVFINPELSGGAALSQAFGVADATNGETFRVGEPAPTIFLARLFYRQLFSLNKDEKYLNADENQLAGKVPTKYFALTIGKIGVADYFDDNIYSHDPRTQFMCWSLMDNGAWDYPANTRGYTPSIVLEYVTPKNELRYAISLEPLEANGNVMDWKINKANSHSLEYTHRYFFKGKAGAIRFLGYFNTANMGNYDESIALNPSAPDIIATRKYGRTKYGFGINAEQSITKDAGIFFRAGWDDGNNETWAFTEIDRTVSAGISSNGNKWNRPNDNVGMAYVVSGISAPHRNYLKHGGKGFELGDGNLNYGLEQLTELYYSAAIRKNFLYLSGAYQFLINPGYNKSRGPVNIFSIRIHAAI
ncbi:MAG TPA: carbohydrate porin [Hanamia sp.]